MSYEAARADSAEMPGIPRIKALEPETKPAPHQSADAHDADVSGITQTS